MIAQVALVLFGVSTCLGAPTAVIVPHVASQYHAQDELGQYAYGYSGGPSAKHEEKTADGITKGGYSYVDGNGLVQSAAYVSDPVNGFRVAATNLPVGPAVPAKPEVAAVSPIAVADVSPIAIDASPAAVAVAPAPVAVAPAPIAVAQAPVAVAQAPVAVAPAPVVEVAPAVAIAPEIKPIEEIPEVSEEKPEVSEEPVEPADSEGTDAEAIAVNEAAPSVADLPEVTAAKIAHLAQVEEVKARNAAQDIIDSQNAAPVSIVTPVPVLAPQQVKIESAPIQTPFAISVVPAVSKTVISTPAVGKTVITEPVVSVAAPAVPIHIASQYHAQDELGQYVYGYAGGPSAKHEEKSFDGITQGGYSYVDAHGIVQSASYVSDPVGGFRVAATNLPRQPAPAYIPDSPEVEEAKQKLFQAQAEHISKLSQVQ